MVATGEVRHGSNYRPSPSSVAASAAAKSTAGPAMASYNSGGDMSSSDASGTCYCEDVLVRGGSGRSCGGSIGGGGSGGVGYISGGSGEHV